MSGGEGAVASTGGGYEQASRRRILVVEDENLIALYLADLLAELGYAVCAPAATGPSALRIADEERPALALVDIHLAGRMDGIETALELRSRFGVRCILLTGSSEGAVRDRVEAAGSLGFVRKPFLPAEIERVLAQAFAGAPEVGRESPP